MNARTYTIACATWISPASNYVAVLVASMGGLLSRGLLEDDATRHRALPRTKQSVQPAPES
jgi:hypothetical protein